MARPATRTPKLNAGDETHASPALEQLAQARSTRLVVREIVLWMKETDQQHAQQRALLDKKLDAILDRLAPAGELPPQLGVRLERHHKELVKQITDLAGAVERLAGAVEAKALASDGYSVQAVEILGIVRKEIAEVRRSLNAPEPLRPIEPLALAVGEEPPSAIVLMRPAA